MAVLLHRDAVDAKSMSVGFGPAVEMQGRCKPGNFCHPTANSTLVALEIFVDQRCHRHRAPATKPDAKSRHGISPSKLSLWLR